MRPKLLDSHVRFRFAPEDPTVTGVTLECDPVVRGPRAFRRQGGAWVLDLPRPSLQRLEYRLAVARGAHVEVVLDPGNPVTVPTAFGHRSVLELPGYAPPWWLAAPAAPGRLDPLTLEGETADEVPVTFGGDSDRPDHGSADGQWSLGLGGRRGQRRVAARSAIARSLAAARANGLPAPSSSE